MKILSICILCILIASPLFAGEIAVTSTYNIYQSEKLEAAPGLKLSGGADHLYVWGSYENTLLRFGGQESVDINLYGAGLGFRGRMEAVTLFMEIGYYYPRYNVSPLFSIESASYAFFESIGLHSPFAHHLYDLSGGFGGQLGIEISHKLTDFISVSGVVAYRALTLKETIYAHNGSMVYADSHWEIFTERDFSAWQVGLTFVWRF